MAALDEARFARIPTVDILPGKNVRVDEAAIDRLMASIREYGVLQPITVVPTAHGDRVECLFGHRRLIAATRVGLPTMPCMVRPRGTDQVRILTQLAENRERRAMSPIEDALAYDDLRKTGMTQQQIADAVGTQQTNVSRMLLLLQYPPSVRRAVHHRKVSVNDVLAMPVDVARRDSPELRLALHAGSNALRKYLARERETAERGGQPWKPGRRTFKPINVDMSLVVAVDDAAARKNQSAVSWVADALRAALAAQAAEESQAST